MRYLEQVRTIEPLRLNVHFAGRLAAHGKKRVTYDLRGKHDRIAFARDIRRFRLQRSFLDQIGQFVHQSRDDKALRLQYGQGPSADCRVDDRSSVSGSHQARASHARPIDVGGCKLGHPADPTIILEQWSVAANYKMNLHAELAGQNFADVQHEQLSAVLIGVMSDQNHFVLRLVEPGGRSDGCACCRVQVGGAEIDIRLEVGAFGPFVPRVDADKAFVKRRVCTRELNELAEPVLVFLRRRAV